MHSQQNVRAPVTFAENWMSLRFNAFLRCKLINYILFGSQHLLPLNICTWRTFKQSFNRHTHTHSWHPIASLAISRRSNDFDNRFEGRSLFICHSPQYHLSSTFEATLKCVPSSWFAKSFAGSVSLCRTLSPPSYSDPASNPLPLSIRLFDCLKKKKLPLLFFFRLISDVIIIIHFRPKLPSSWCSIVALARLLARPPARSSLLFLLPASFDHRPVVVLAVRWSITTDRTHFHWHSSSRQHSIRFELCLNLDSSVGLCFFVRYRLCSCSNQHEFPFSSFRRLRA